MNQSTMFNQRVPGIEAKFITLTKEFSLIRKTVRTRAHSSFGVFKELLGASIVLFTIERRLYRIGSTYQSLLIQFPPADSTEALKRMETLSFFIRNIQEMIIDLGNEAENSIERIYLSRVCDTLDALLRIWDAYADMTNDDLISRIKDASLLYLPQVES